MFRDEFLSEAKKYEGAFDWTKSHLKLSKLESMAKNYSISPVVFGDIFTKFDLDVDRYFKDFMEYHSKKKRKFDFNFTLSQLIFANKNHKDFKDFVTKYKKDYYPY